MNAFLRDAPGVLLAILCGLAVTFLPSVAAMVYVQGAVLYLFNGMRIDVALAWRRIPSSTTMSVVFAAIWPVLLGIQFVVLTWDLLLGLGRLLVRPFKRA